jgi:hypothetical protein
VGAFPHPVEVTPPSFVDPPGPPLLDEPLLLDERPVDDDAPPVVEAAPEEEPPPDGDALLAVEAALDAAECDELAMPPEGALLVFPPPELDETLELSWRPLVGPVEWSTLDPPPQPDRKAATVTAGRLGRMTTLRDTGRRIFSPTCSRRGGLRCATIRGQRIMTNRLALPCRSERGKGAVSRVRALRHSKRVSVEAGRRLQRRLS